MKSFAAFVSCFLLAMTNTFAEAPDPIKIARIGITIEPNANKAEAQAADLLKMRILQISTLSVDIGTTPITGVDLQIYLGKARDRGRLYKLCTENAVVLPNRKNSFFAEGFAIKTVPCSGDAMIVSIGADDRGVLYAVGEIIRRLRYFEDHLELTPFEIQSAPGFRYRGSSANQGGTMMKITKARGWSEDELHGVILEYALAGANTFYCSDQPSPYYNWMKSYGLMTVTGARPNQLYGEFPEAWKAHGREAWEGKQWVCPSVPEARAALLKQWEEDFSKRADHEVMRFYAGDPGGCTCTKCTPWGKTFVHLSEEMAAIWLKKHPNSSVQIANQGLDNAGDRAILDYLNEKPRTWSEGLCYGPGSNAMSPYFRDIDMRDDLFEYLGQGWVNRYVAELHRGLPTDQRLIHYSDITHYISAQFALENPEPNLVRSYGRRTFHARPVAMYNTFHAIMPFSEGDIIYSEGNHDEFHQYIWNRMLWDPNRTLEDLMMEYCTLQFGEEATPDMVQALLQLEKNMVAPLAENEGISRYYALVKAAGEKMPPWRMARDWRWRLHMQKAALDRFVQLKLQIELDKQRRVKEILTSKRGDSKDAIAQALAICAEPAFTPEMEKLREEAGKLGEESNAKHGDRNPGYFRLDQSLRDIPGLADALKNVQAAKERKERKEKLREVIESLDSTPRRANIFW
jgi:hypothetical protein